MKTGEPLLSIRNVEKRFGAATVLSGMSLDIAPNEFLTILGESGSGKTTLLRIIAGFERADAGEVWMQGERLDALPPEKRDLNTVFQNYALFPHLSVLENVAFGLRAKKVSKKETAERVEAALAQMKMAEFAGRRPAQLSGGQQQRVALARALVNRPRLLLLDEPLSALDANLRRHMQFELKSLQRETGIAFVFVTHDQDEAMTLSDRIALLRSGRMEQIGTPRSLYDEPRTVYSATFIGHTNVLKAAVRDGVARCGPLAWPCDWPAGETTVSLRPEHIRFAHGSTANICVPAQVKNAVFTGASELLEVDCGGGLSLKVRVPNQSEHMPGDALEIDPRHLVRVVEGQV